MFKKFIIRNKNILERIGATNSGIHKGLCSIFEFNSQKKKKKKKKKKEKKRKIYVEFISRSYVFSINFDTRNRFFYQCRSLRYGIHTNESCKLIRRPYRIRTHIRRANFVKNASTFSIVRIRTVQLLV